MEVANIAHQDSPTGTVLTADYLGSPIGAALGGLFIKTTRNYKACIILSLVAMTCFYLVHSLYWKGLISLTIFGSRSDS